MICWRGTAASASELASRFRCLSEIDARSYLLIVEARRASDGLVPLLFLRSAGRRDVTAYADGETGLWSRILAPLLGAALVFAGSAVNDRETSDGLGPQRMIDEFGLPSLPTVDRICGIVGAGANRSLSPGLHNAAYRALGYPGWFLPFRVDAFDEFWREVVESQALEQLGLRTQGFTVASPNKEAAVTMLKVRGRASRDSGSANLVFRRGPAWAATTTDPSRSAGQPRPADTPGAAGRRRRLWGLRARDRLSAQPGGSAHHPGEPISRTRQPGFASPGAPVRPALAILGRRLRPHHQCDAGWHAGRGLTLFPAWRGSTYGRGRPGLYPGPDTPGRIRPGERGAGRRWARGSARAGRTAVHPDDWAGAAARPAGRAHWAGTAQPGWAK